MSICNTDKLFFKKQKRQLVYQELQFKHAVIRVRTRKHTKIQQLHPWVVELAVDHRSMASFARFSAPLVSLDHLCVPKWEELERRLIKIFFKQFNGLNLTNFV